MYRLTAEALRKYQPYTNMRGIEYHLLNVSKHLKKRRRFKDRYMAENLDFCLFCLKVMFPDLFPEPAPAFLEMPLFEEAERKDEEVASRRLAAREARRACK